jgi:DNA-binding NarL/FixJ family response regulator
MLDGHPLRRKTIAAQLIQMGDFELDEAIRYALGETPKNTPPGPVRADVPGGLTKREQEIAELVAQGRPTRPSPRT